ncbi:MAG: sulfite reductase subunit A, partial [Planctomycetes bacterium RBG_16_59_8]
GEIRSVEDLPRGWTDEQEKGLYRLRRREDDALFGYAVGPHSWKMFLNPSARRLWRSTREGKGFRIDAEKDEQPPMAFIGVRACELSAMAIQDKVFLGGQWIDPLYRRRREGAFIVAVNCGTASGTCFCVSMGTGPKVSAGFDLALTELLEGGRHALLVEVGSERGGEMLRGLSCPPAGAKEDRVAAAVVEKTAASMGRTLDLTGLKDLLSAAMDHPRWDDVAECCLTCANCTMVCPTCFCSTVEDVTDLTGDHAERWRKWDSCFTMDFSSLHGGSVRATPKARYRQWMTHKLSTWHDQFGTSGCVGCGRCIAWCPAAIDITEEARALKEVKYERT